MTSDELLDIATTMGKYLLESGAEIYRVEDSIERIIKTYPVHDVHVYAVSNTIIVSISPINGSCLTKTIRIKERSTNLDRVQHLNELSRFIVTNKPTYKKILNNLNTILTRPVYSIRVKICAYAMTSSTFALFFDGTIRDMISGLCIGPTVFLLANFLSTRKTNPFFITMSCSLLATILSILLLFLNIGQHLDIMIISVIMNLVPGVSLTNAVRDLIAGDILAGLSRITEAIITATCIAIGTGIPLSLIQ